MLCVQQLQILQRGESMGLSLTNFTLRNLYYWKLRTLYLQVL